MYTRRETLVLVAVALGGCSTADEPTPDADAGPSSTATDGAGDGRAATDATAGSGMTTDDAVGSGRTAPDGTDDSSATTDETATGDAGLDLREANVTGVEMSGSDDERRFDVTLYHDDDGEDGYANWWQVETLDGRRLGRRDLLHAHGTREFTRSATVVVPDGTTCVVVRGHDETHGYGGRAALVTLDSGAVSFVDQGPEPRSFGEDDCP